MTVNVDGWSKSFQAELWNIKTDAITIQVLVIQYSKQQQ